MKAVLIMHNVAIDADVTEALEAVGVKCYSKFTNVLGRGAVSEPHLDDEVWPGTNNGTLVITESAKAAEIMGLIRKLREKLGGEGIKAFMWDIEDVT